MKNKKILIYAAGPIFPIVGMNQVRILNQIKSLAEDHVVDCMFLYTKKVQKKATIDGLSNICDKVIPFHTWSQSMFFRLAKKLFLNKLFQKVAQPLDYFSLSNTLSSQAIARRINQEKYDIVISHYWQASGFLKFLKKPVKKYIDTHYLVEENLEIYEAGHYSHLSDSRLGKLLQKEFQLQKKMFGLADGFIVNSIIQKNILDDKYPREKTLCVPNGQDLDSFFAMPVHNPTNEFNLLFYGALANQFNGKAIKRIIKEILPLIKEQIPGMNLIIMGAGPPQWLRDMVDDDPSIQITGFVADVRTVFCDCLACLIPLETGSGFRGRAVEIMASGLPLVGTSNAFKSVEIKNEVHGLIAESNEELAEQVIRLAVNKQLWEKLSENGRALAKQNYTRQATFGRLSQYFLDL